ncbi:hypothetical protein R1flu_013161 [Riccia fluitans]|uniref:DUF676 domain-containing protein n=1 Tax=Riccia fluitans TaxID=41844 RepID=A0ABD1XHJ9_9MARC
MESRKSERWRDGERRSDRRRRGWCECCRIAEEEGLVVEKKDGNKSLGKSDSVGKKIGDGNLVGVMNGDLDPPVEHLVIMVNGIIGSAEDWKFGAEHFRERLGKSVAIHCSTCNSARATFDGVDTMGKRLAEEVREIIKVTKGLKRISFVSHSLGGLISRYAISKLYRPPENGRPEEGTIEGLEPVNFITVATPHLGSRGSQNLPFLGGIQLLEKTAPYLAHWIIGQTGKHLFLTDGNPKKNILPLLRRMVTDCDEGLFLSSLKAFRRRTLYANVVYDHAVGWRTASFRRKSELPELKHEPLDKRYPHIVRDEECKGVGPNSTQSAAVPCADPVEEEILAGLNQLSWRKVDVSFKGAKAGFQAHNTIQVKNAKTHSEGQDVIDHIIDKHFLLEEDSISTEVAVTEDSVGVNGGVQD